MADFDAVLAAASSDNVLEAAIAPLVTAIDLDSPLAARLRAEYEQWVAVQQPKPKPSEAPIEQALTTALANTEQTRYFQVHILLYERKKDLQHPNDPVPGWSGLNPAIRSEILMAAREYLKTRPPAPLGSWWKPGLFSFGMIAGSSALHLLAVESPDSLDAISDEDWDFWMPIVVAYTGDQQGGHPLVVSKAHERAKGKFTAILDEVIEGEDARFGRVMALHYIDTLWSDELAAMLRARIASLKPEAFKDVVAVLLEKADLQTKELARRMATAPVPVKGDDRLRSVFAAVELLAHDPQ